MRDESAIGSGRTNAGYEFTFSSGFSKICTMDALIAFVEKRHDHVKTAKACIVGQRNIKLRGRAPLGPIGLKANLAYRFVGPERQV